MSTPLLPQCWSPGIPPLLHPPPPTAGHDAGLPGEPVGVHADAAVVAGISLLVAHLRPLPGQRRYGTLTASSVCWRLEAARGLTVTLTVTLLSLQAQSIVSENFARSSWVPSTSQQLLPGRPPHWYDVPPFHLLRPVKSSSAV